MKRSTENRRPTPRPATATGERKSEAFEWFSISEVMQL